MTEKWPKFCVAYDTHGNEPGNCCGCHYECGEEANASVHIDSTLPKFHAFVAPPEGGT